jgi:RNA polymerase-associated protein CTR9
MQAESLFQLGRVHHVRQEYENALKLYEKACKLYPDLTPARFGLAQVLLTQEDYKNSMAELKKVVLKSPTATDALALLGLLQVRAGQTKEGLLNLRKAMDLDPLNPDLILLEALALQQDTSTYSTSLERYQKAIDLLEASSQTILYELFGNLGVLCHETKDYDQALRYYTRALEALDSKSDFQISSMVVRHHCNSMFWTFVETPTLAIAPMESTTNIQVQNLDGVSIGDVVRIADMFTSEVVAVHESSIELAEPFAFSDAAKTEQSNNGVPAKDSMNDSDKTDESKNPENHEDVRENKSIFLKVEVKRDNGRLQNRKAITIAFNIARAHENAGQTLAAVELHKAIVKLVPSYVNCYLRLACIARDSGCLKECSAWLKIACTAAPGNPEVLTLVGNLHLSLCDWGPAQNVFDQLLMKRVASVEAYSKLSMGNIYFANLDHPKSYGKHLKKAVDLYKSILTKDNANAYAANGIGTALAEKGELFKAKEVFNRVREVSGDTIADALLNLGHIYLAQKKHPEALQMYQSYMKRTQDGTAPITTKSREDDEAEVLLYIAFTYFDWARQTEAFNNAQAAPADARYRTCMEHLEMALQKSRRREVVLNYNLCMTKLQAANCVLQKLTRNIRRTAQEVEEALKGLEESLPKVEEMLRWKEDGKKVLIPKSMLQDFITHCKSNIESAKVHLEEERRKEQEAEEIREIQRSAAEAQKQEEELRKLMEQEKEAREQEERDRKAAAKMTSVEQLRAGWVHEAEMKKQQEKEKKVKTGRKGPPPPDDFIVDDDEEALVDNTAALFEDSSDEERNDKRSTVINTNKESESKQPNRIETTEKDLFGDSSDEESDEELISSDPKKRDLNDTQGEQEQTNKRQRVIDDDDE